MISRHQSIFNLLLVFSLNFERAVVGGCNKEAEGDMQFRRWLHYRYLSFSFLFLIIACSIGEKTEITLRDFEKVSMGMTYEEVVHTFGVEGEQLSENNVSPMSTTIYVWEGNGDVDQVTLVFRDNKLIHKQQMGLE